MPEADGYLLGAQRRWIDDRRGPLMFMAFVAGTVSGLAGVYPPGGVYRTGPHALEPVLRVHFPDRYEYFNASHWLAFWFSLFLVVLLSAEVFYRTREGMNALVMIAVVDLACIASTFACYHYLACLVYTLG